MEAMDIVTIEHELATLPADQQDRLAAFLTALRMRRDGMLAEVCRRLDDKDPEKWREWGMVKEDLGLEYSGT